MAAFGWAKFVRYAIVWLLAPVALLAMAGRAHAASGVRDDAHFFSGAAVAQADQIIREIHSRWDKDFLVETFPAIPSDLKQQYDSMGRDQFFADWCKLRAGRLNMNGIYMLVCRTPAHMELWVGDQTKQHFSSADQAELRQLILNDFRAENYDQGLVDGARYIESAFARDASGRGQGNPIGRYSTGPGIGCFGIMITMLIVFLVLRLMVAVLHGSWNHYGGGTYGWGGGYGGWGGGYGGGYGGGGFGRGLFGGILGGLAGNWMYDQFFHGGGNWGGFSGGGSMGGNDFGQGQDAGGGDFGGGGGGDFGGGGGGDVGGGDFGGGSNA